VVDDAAVLCDAINDFIIALKAKNVTQSVVDDSVNGLISVAKLLCNIFRKIVVENEKNSEVMLDKMSCIENVLDGSSIARSSYKLKIIIGACCMRL